MNPLVDKRKLSLLITGDEVLYGDITDTNSSLISKAFEEFGFRALKKRVVGDDLGSLVEELRELSALSDILVINGGLGSTVDDKTNEAIAQAFGWELAAHPKALAHLERRGIEAVEEGSPWYKQCMLPQGALTFENPAGSALGYSVKTPQGFVIATPGPPHELSAMLEKAILPWARENYPENSLGQLCRFMVFGVGESQIEDMILTHFEAHETVPFQKLKLGFRAVAPFTEVKLWGEPEEKQLLKQTELEMLDLLGDACFSRNQEMPLLVSELLRQRSSTLSLAESCTGGLLASMVTALPGASEILLAAVVSYAYKAKEQFLGVDHQRLVEKGAVSQAVAEEMFDGILSRSQSDYAISITGIAGPTGGLPNKPVGTVFITVGDANRRHTRRLVVAKERTGFQRHVALTALDLLRRFLLGLDLEAPYYFDDLSKNRS